MVQADGIGSDSLMVTEIGLADQTAEALVAETTGMVLSRRYTPFHEALFPALSSAQR